MTDLARHIRDIPDFPKPGVVFKDITPLLADGGTASAAVEFVRRCGGGVGACAFVIELAFLSGRQRRAGQDVFALVRYDGPWAGPPMHARDHAREIGAVRTGLFLASVLCL